MCKAIDIIRVRNVSLCLSVPIQHSEAFNEPNSSPDTLTAMISLLGVDIHLETLVSHAVGTVPIKSTNKANANLHIFGHEITNPP
jgi:hypothetical protein